MWTALLATLNVIEGARHEVWTVNTDAGYLEDGVVIEALLDFIFFFKQKTAYEITRYWSSDVCSSDLHHHLLRRHRESPRAAGFSDSLEEFDLPAVGIRTLMRRASTAPCAPDSG